MRNSQARLDFVDTHDFALSERLGAVGYCTSGPFVFKTASYFPTRFLYAASIYGAHLVTNRDDSPHLDANKIMGELHFDCAEIDHYASIEVVHQLKASLAQTTVTHRIEWYPGAEHGFAFPDRGEIYHKPSAERHWARLHAVFDRCLRQARMS